MKYTKTDLTNIIALCEQDDFGHDSQAEKLRKRCEKALAYNYVAVRLTHKDKDFLQSLYDQEMDPEAKQTLDKFLH